MLEITDKHRELFSAYALKCYIAEELYPHCKAYFPHLMSTLGDEQAILLLTRAVEIAKSAGYSTQGGIQFYIDLMLFFGGYFAKDMQYQWLTENTSAIVNEIQRTDVLYDRLSVYFEQVVGEKSEYLSDALDNFSRIEAFHFHVDTDEKFSQQLLDTLFILYPEKIQFIGQETYRLFIHQNMQYARTHHHFTCYPQLANFIVIQLFLGQYIDSDPIYAWFDSEALMEKIKSNQFSVKEFAERMKQVLLP